MPGLGTAQNLCSHLLSDTSAHYKLYRPLSLCLWFPSVSQGHTTLPCPEKAQQSSHSNFRGLSWTPKAMFGPSDKERNLSQSCFSSRVTDFSLEAWHFLQVLLPFVPLHSQHVCLFSGVVLILFARLITLLFIYFFMLKAGQILNLVYWIEKSCTLGIHSLLWFSLHFSWLPAR